MQTSNIGKDNKLKSLLNILNYDLKTPINNIIGFSDLLENLLTECENKDIASFIKIINAQAKYANTLIDKLSDYNKSIETNFAEIDAIKIKEILEISRKEHEAVFS